MELHSSTTALLAALDELSGNTLTCREDLGILIELATRHGRLDALDELSFTAKFAHKTSGIMGRIGPGANGYEGLQRELGASIERIRGSLGAVLADAPADVATHFHETYLAFTPVAFDRLLALCHTLSWYKNRQIDAARGKH